LRMLLLVPTPSLSLLALASSFSIKTNFKVFPSAMDEASRRKLVLLALWPLGWPLYAPPLPRVSSSSLSSAVLFPSFYQSLKLAFHFS
jgi:hypothetical protein